MQEEQRDQRGYLKVKIKSLAEEAKIIRNEERKATGEKREGLYLHRIGTVRKAARHTLLAYGFLRGRKYRQMEAKCEASPMWPEVFKMVVKYGLQDYGWKIWKRGEQEVAKEELLKRFEEWKSEAIG
jgi:hypothetical protein